MNPDIEKSLIMMYRQLRKKPDLSNSDIIGLFINYYYQFTKTHGGLFTKAFCVVKWENIKTIRSQTKPPFHTYTKEEGEIKKALSSISNSTYFSLYLRSSFENPKDDDYGDSTIRGIVVPVMHTITKFNIENSKNQS